MRLEALKLALQYVGPRHPQSQVDVNIILDTANKFMVFLNSDDKKLDNPNDSGSNKISSKTLNLKGSGQSHSGSN